MDLCVCGTSFTAGYGTGTEHVPETADSWPRQLASNLNVANFYNYSKPVRTIHSSVKCVRSFVTAYKANNERVDDLFMIIEFSDPVYLDLGIVKTKDGNIAEPVILFTNPEGGELLNEPRILFTAQDRIGNLETNFNEYGKGFSRNDIDPLDYQRVKDNIQTAFVNTRATSTNSISMLDRHPLIYEAIIAIRDLKRYLEREGIQYMFTWAFDSRITEQVCLKYHESLYNEVFGVRFISAFSLSVSLFIIKHDLAGYENHPTPEGHKLYSECLQKYITDNNLFKEKT